MCKNITILLKIGNRKAFFMRRFFEAFGLVVCIVAALTRSTSPDAQPVNKYRSDFTAISVGKNYLCLKTKNKKGMCYKPYLSSQHKRTLDEYFSDYEVSDDVPIKKILNTEYNFCVITFADTAKCGGLNDRRQLGRGAADNNSLFYIRFFDSFKPYTVSAFAGARDHLCAVVDGEARCWASNSYAQSTGNTNTPLNYIYPDNPIPPSVDLPEKINQITASNESTCARGLSGSVYCWGNNRHGELGTATDIGHNAPHTVTKVPLPHPATKLFDRRTATSCATLTNSSTYCWGGIHTNNGTYAPGPIQLKTTTNLKEISGKIALTTTGRLVYIKQGPYNQTTHTIPTTITPLDARGKVTSISGHPNGIHCWVTTTGAAYCLNTTKQTIQIAQY